MQDREPLINEVVGDMAALYGGLQELNTPTWLRLDLTMAQFRALVVVSHRPDITVGDVGCQLSIGQSAASVLVDHLVRRGFVARTEDPADRRRALLNCTASGHTLLGDLRAGNRQVLKERLSRLSDDELWGLAQGMRALLEAVLAPVPAAATIAAEATEANL